MPGLLCPLGIRCTDGEAGGTWKSVEDVTFEQAYVLVADHVKIAHQNVAYGAAPAQLNLNVDLLSPTIEETCDSVKKLSALLTSNVSDLKDFAQASLIPEIRGLKMNSATRSTTSAASATPENITPFPFKLIGTPSGQIYMAPDTQSLGPNVLGGGGEKELAVLILDGKENKPPRNTTKGQEGIKNEDDATPNKTKASPSSSSVDLMDWETSPQSVNQ